MTKSIPIPPEVSSRLSSLDLPPDTVALLERVLPVLLQPMLERIDALEKAVEQTTAENKALKRELAEVKRKRTADRKIIRAQRDTIARLEGQVEKLEVELKEHRRHRFGGKSENIDPILSDADKEVLESVDFGDRANPAGSGRGRGGRKRRFPDHLERETVVLEVGCSCPDCGSKDLEEMGDVVTETLAEREARYVIRTVRKKARCEKCNKIIEAKAPPSVVNRRYVDESFESNMAIAKILYGMPIHRQHKELLYHDIHVSNAMMNNQFNRLGEVLDLLYDLLRQDMLASDRIIADDSVFPLNDSAKPGKKTRGRLWHYVVQNNDFGGSGPALAYLEFTPDWKADHPKKLLAAFEGFLQGDSYPGWRALEDASGGRIVLMNCWAHSRRKFVVILRNNTKLGSKERKLGLKVLKLMRALFAVERDLFGKDPDTRLRGRQERSVPLVEELKKLIEDHRPSIDNKSPMAGAIDYLLNSWAYFTVFLDHGEVSLTTNVVEGVIRTFANGRKNWTHGNLLEGAKAYATIASLLMTCILNGINPHKWLVDVLRRLPHTPMEELSSLLPYHWKPTGTGPDRPPGGNPHLEASDRHGDCDGGAGAEPVPAEPPENVKETASGVHGSSPASADRPPKMTGGADDTQVSDPSDKPQHVPKTMHSEGGKTVADCSSPDGIRMRLSTPVDCTGIEPPASSSTLEFARPNQGLQTGRAARPGADLQNEPTVKLEMIRGRDPPIQRLRCESG